MTANTPKRKPGRPPGATGKARGEVLRVRMSAEEMAQVRAKAEGAGLSVGAWVRGELLSPTVDPTGA